MAAKEDRFLHTGFGPIVLELAAYNRTGSTRSQLTVVVLTVITKGRWQAGQEAYTVYARPTVTKSDGKQPMGRLVCLKRRSEHASRRSNSPGMGAMYVPMDVLMMRIILHGMVRAKCIC